MPGSAITDRRREMARPGLRTGEQWQETIDYIMDMIRQQQGKSSGTRRIMKRNLSGKRRKAVYSTAAFVV